MDRAQAAIRAARLPGRRAVCRIGNASLLMVREIVLDRSSRTLVYRIRRACALEFRTPLNFSFFSANYRPGESSDAALLRIFRAEQAACGWDEAAVIETLIFG